MNILGIIIGFIYAGAIALGIFGGIRFLRFAPAYLAYLKAQSKSIFHFRYAGYVDWLAATDRPKNNGAFHFVIGLAIALLAFPFLLIV